VFKLLINKELSFSLSLISTRKIDFGDVDGADDCHSYLHAKIQTFMENAFI
jgi:hypothetical protein